MAGGLRVRLPKLDRHKSGQARVRIKGRSFYLGKFGTAEAEERDRRILAEYVTTGDVPRTTEPDDAISVNELVLRFWKEHVAVAYRKNGKNTSEVSLFRSALDIVKNLFGSMPVDQFSPKCLRLARELMYRPKEEAGKGWTRQTTNSQTRRITQMFRWGVSHELAAPEVLHRLEAIEGLKKGRTEASENGRIEAISIRSLRPTLRQLPTVVRDMVRFQLRTGCRPGEVCQIRPCDVVRDGAVWEYTPESHKTEHHGD